MSRPIGLSKRSSKSKTLSSSSNKMSLEDVSQQPPVLGSSLNNSPPKASTPASSHRAQETYPPSPSIAPPEVPAGLLLPPSSDRPRFPPSSDPADAPLVAATSDLTQGSDNSTIHWESNPTHLRIRDGSPKAYSLQVPLEEEAPRSPQPTSSAPMGFLASQTPEYANQSLADAAASAKAHPPPDAPGVGDSGIDELDPSEDEMTDNGDDVDEDGSGEEGSAERVSTPPNSTPEEPSAAPVPDPTTPSPQAAFRPITQSVPGLSPSASSRPLISPSKHAANLATPRKKTPGNAARLASSATQFRRPRRVTSPTPAISSSIPTATVPRTVVTSRHSGPSDNSGEGDLTDDSDFAKDMVNGPPKMKPFEKFDATVRPIPLDKRSGSARSGPGSPKRDRHSPSKAAGARVSPTSPAKSAYTSTADSTRAAPGLEPTLLNDDEEGRPEGDLGSELTPPRPSQQSYYGSPTQIDPANSVHRTSPMVRSGGEDIMMESPTQLNSDNRPPSSPPARALRGFNNGVASQPAPSSPHLLSESMGMDMDEVSRPASQREFEATQIEVPGDETSPVKPAPEAGEGTSPRASLLERPPASDSGSTTHKGGEGVAALPPSEPEFEPTYVDPASLKTNESSSSKEVAPAPASDPIRILPSSEPPQLQRAAASAPPPLSTPLSPPPPDDTTMEDIAPVGATSTDKRQPVQATSSQSLVIPPPSRPRTSPLKTYGKQNKRQSAAAPIPSTRSAMPRVASAAGDHSSQEDAGFPTEKGLLPSASPAAKARRRPASRSPSPSPPLKKATRRPATRLDSSSSGSEPEDPDDATFQDDPNAAEDGSSSDPSPPPPPSPPVPPPRKQKAKAKMTGKVKATSKAKEPKVTTPAKEKAPPHASSRPVRDKRKALSSEPENSDDSSSAPEDDEDFSYRPTELGRARAKAEATAAARARKQSETAERESSSEVGFEDPEAAAPAKGKGKRVARASTPSASKQPRNKRARTSGGTSSSKSRSSRSVPSTSRSAKEASAANANESAAPASLRVLALWKSFYYPGTVVERAARGFKVHFDDQSTGVVGLDRLRRLQLRLDEPVYTQDDPNVQYRMAEQNEGDVDVKVVNGGDEIVIPWNRLVLLPDQVDKRFIDRVIPQDELNERFPVLRPPRPPPLPASADAPFEGKSFLVTGEEGKQSLYKKIEDKGGTVVLDWTRLFDIASDGYATLTPGSVPFVINYGTSRLMSSKVMSALAAGVPVLSGRYIVDVHERSSPVDWRNYLIAPCQSRQLGETMSQVIDPQWGEPTWDAAEARPVRQPLAGMRVLFVEAGPKYKHRAEINSIVPFCVRAMGAQLTVAKTMPKDLVAEPQDLVMVEDRDPARANFTIAQKRSGKLVNVGWLKACLVAGISLEPMIIQNKSV